MDYKAARAYTPEEAVHIALHASYLGCDDAYGGGIRAILDHECGETTMLKHIRSSALLLCMEVFSFGRTAGIRCERERRRTHAHS